MIVVACAVPLVPSVGHAQIITGQVVDSTAHTAVGTGFVVLIDATDTELVRTLTSADGRFRLEVQPHFRGPFRIRSERIGYRQSTSSTITIGANETLEYELLVTALPVQLAAITVEEDRRCRTRPDEGERTAVVWEEARKALAAASWTASQGIYRYQSVLYERRMDRQRRNVTEEKTRVSSGYYKTPFTSRDPGLLVEEGFVVSRDGDNWYYAPDANVLRSHEFLETHCFRVIRDDKEPGLIGLSFEPAPGRNRADIEGVLWLNEESAELQSVQYTYTRDPNEIRDDRIGGTVEFMPVPSGAWIVNNWQIRMPAMAVREVRDARMPGGKRQEVFMEGFMDAGGEVVEITTMTGETLYAAELSRMEGEVFDSSRTVPAGLADAIVRIVGTSFTDTTDWRGRYQIAAPLTGRYGVAFEHGRADSLGFNPAPVKVDLVPGRTASVSLSLPPLPELLELLCEDDELRKGRRVVVGVVRDGATGNPFAGATVSASWQAFGAGTEGTIEGRRVSDLEATVVTDSLGFYAFCSFEVERPVQIHASRANRTSTPVRLVFEHGGVGINDEYFVTDRPIWKLDIDLYPGTH